MDFYKLFINVPETLVVIAPDYTILAATEAYLRATMRSRDELIGRNLLKAFPDNPDTPESSNTALLQKSIDKAKTSRKDDFLDVLRYDIPRPDSEGGGFDLRYWEACHTPVVNENNEVIYIIQNTKDVTEREVAKRALFESENKFRFMAEAMPQLIYTTDKNGKTDYFNERWAKYTGVPVKELLSFDWSSLLHPDDLDSIMEKWGEAFKNNRPFQFDMRVKNAEGNYRWFLNRGVPMRDADKNVIMWVGSATDIQDTKKMIEELLHSNEEMSRLSDQVNEAYSKAESERQALERLIMQAPAIFCTLQGPEHRFDLVNPRYQQLFPNRKLIGKPVAEALPEVVEQGFVRLLDDVFSSGKEFTAEEVAVKIDRFDTGKTEDIYLTFTYQPLFENKKVTGILVFAVDVTHQVLLRKKLEEMGHGSDKK